MKKKALMMFLLCAALLPTHSVNAAETYQDVAAFDVQIVDELKVPFSESNENYFAGGLVTGFGSAVTFKGVDEQGNLQFYAITDRGPNADTAKYQLGDKVTDAKVFPCPEFTPSIGILTIKGDTAVVTESIPLKNADNQPISGLPLTPGQVGSTGEVALDMNNNMLSFDAEGMDTEGIAVDAEGNFWICDEYGPFVAKYDKTGKLLEKYAPGAGLPAILSSRIPNRGCEGLTITPSGKVIISMQSVLDVDGKTSKTACFVRFVELDPVTKQCKTYAYPVDTTMYKSPKDCKIGDIYAIDDDTLLVIEQGKLADKTMSNKIMKVDLSKANDITNLTFNGQSLEFAGKEELQGTVNFIQKELYIDLRAAGWTAEKAEGICVLPDHKTIAVINDNDFGIVTQTTDPDHEDTDITDYVYDASTGTYTLDGEKANVTTAIGENTEPAQIWLFEANEEIK